MRKIKPYILYAIISLLLAACGGAETEARKAVLKMLKDPDSAKFGKFTNVNEKAACLTVNARNSMGGYTGDQQAYLIIDEGKWIAIDISTLSHDDCIELMTKYATKKKANN